MTVRDDATQAVPTPPAEGAARRSSRCRSWLRPGVLLLMRASVAAVIAAHRGEVAAALRELSPGYAVAALPGAFAAMVAALFVWRSLLADLGARISVPD